MHQSLRPHNTHLWASPCPSTQGLHIKCGTKWTKCTHTHNPPNKNFWMIFHDLPSKCEMSVISDVSKQLAGTAWRTVPSLNFITLNGMILTFCQKIMQNWTELPTLIHYVIRSQYTLLIFTYLYLSLPIFTYLYLFRNTYLKFPWILFHLVPRANGSKELTLTCVCTSSNHLCFKSRFGGAAGAAGAASGGTTPDTMASLGCGDMWSNYCVRDLWYLWLFG